MSDLPESVQTSKILSILEELWGDVRLRFAELPPVTITLGPSSTAKEHSRLVFGHFAPERWTHGQELRHEVFIAGEGLQHGPEELVDTILHEAAHALALARSVQDTSRQGRYHNKHYKVIAEELGLSVTQIPGWGWSETKLSDPTRAQYSSVIEELAAVMSGYRKHESAVRSPTPPASGAEDEAGEGEAEQVKPGSRLLMKCACEPARSFRISPSIAELGEIICAVCRSFFTVS